MNTSETIAELTAALAQAQGEFRPVKKSGKNTFLKSDYATLDDVIAAVRTPLSNHELSFIQPLTGNGEGFTLETVLLHSSGEWLSCASNIPAWSGKGITELQAFGGALTYMRRYMLTAMLGVTSEEDTDGNASKGKDSAKKKATPAKRPTQSLEPTTFNLTPPDWADWDNKQWPQLWTAAVKQLQYQHTNHVKNTLKQVFNGDAGNMTYGAAWTALVEHQQSKQAATVDAKPIIDDLFPLAEEVGA
jgi:hypothetical protein